MSELPVNEKDVKTVELPSDGTEPELTITKRKIGSKRNTTEFKDGFVKTIMAGIPPVVNL